MAEPNVDGRHKMKFAKDPEPRASRAVRLAKRRQRKALKLLNKWLKGVTWQA